MKTSIFLASFFVFLLGCQKKGSNIDNPDVDLFVQQLKSGTYDDREIGEDGQVLWLKTPKFTQQHIARLIELSKDTTHIYKFPTNPMSSRSPHPQGRNYFILGEGLLWIVEYIRGARSFDPYMIDTSKEIPERFNGITALEVLDVRDKYEQWWDAYKNGDWKTNNPLENTSYRWL